jgi:hypothetical protein
MLMECGGKKRPIYRRNRPWRPIGLWDVEAPTLFRQSAHISEVISLTHQLATLYGQEISWVLISVRGWVDHRAIVRLEGLNQLKKSSDLIGNWTFWLVAFFIIVIIDSEDQDVGGWTILKWVLQRYDGMVWTGSNWLRIGTSGGLLWTR